MISKHSVSEADTALRDDFPFCYKTIIFKRTLFSLEKNHDEHKKFAAMMTNNEYIPSYVIDQSVQN